MEIPAPADGVAEDLKVSPGDQVEVGEVIMELETGSDPETSEDEHDTSEQGTAEEKTTDGNKDEVKSPDTSSGSGNVLALPKVRKMAEEKDVELAAIKTGERITEEEVIEAAESENNGTEVSGDDSSRESSGDVKATPSVRRLAREEEVDISEVEGSGKGGKITRQDVMDYEEGTGETHEEETSVQESRSVDSSREVERVEMSGVKKKTAERMAESRFTAPHVTHVEKADLTDLKELREQEKEEVEPHLTYLPFIMKAVTEAMKDYPQLNAELDTEENEIVEKKFYDFNIAVDTENGLLTPKISDVDSKSIVELASEIGDKAERARNRDLSPEELENGSFSITNLGVIGGEEFTPIINFPQTAILGVGRIDETAEVVDGEVVPRTTVKLSLSYDHRVVDGATGARFMNEVVENLEKPEKMLLEL